LARIQPGDFPGLREPEILAGKRGPAKRLLRSEHTALILPIGSKAVGGPDCLADAALACHDGSRKKADQNLKISLKRKPELRQKIFQKAQATLKDRQ
jgi:hypothetical protein